MMVIGIDIGGTHVRALLTDGNGKVLGFRKIVTASRPDTIIADIRFIINELTSGLHSPGAVRAIGIGSAGSIDRKKGLIITSPNVPALQGFRLVSALEKTCGTKVYLENDATAALVGEGWQGQGRKYRTWLMITLGTGIGGGVVIDNRVYTGRRGSAMEIGHTSIDYRGRRCPCGNTGCLEMYASATALVRCTRQRLRRHPESSLHGRTRNQKLTSKIIYEEALKGDVLSITVFNEVSTWLGIGIANLVNLFNPEAVVFGGGLSRAHRFILPVVRKVVAERALNGLKSGVRYLVSRDEEKAPALGAAKIALDLYNKGA